MSKINDIADLVKYDIPTAVLTDVDKRIGDWLASGGEETDPYVKRQLQYAEKFIKEA